jgi:hypothetical protein
MAGNDIFLYSVPSDADQDDIRLRDPTVAAGGAGAYEITATSSAIVLSGSSVILAFGRVILASTSAIALAASSVGLAKGYSLSATSSAIALSGSSAVLQFGSKISATSSAITLAGSSAGLTVNRNISAVSSAIVLSGSTVTLTYTPVVSSYEIEAVSSAIALAGSSVDLVYVPAASAPGFGGWRRRYGTVGKLTSAEWEKARKAFAKARRRRKLLEAKTNPKAIRQLPAAIEQEAEAYQVLVDIDAIRARAFAEDAAVFYANEEEELMFILALAA